MVVGRSTDGRLPYTIHKLKYTFVVLQVSRCRCFDSYFFPVFYPNISAVINFLSFFRQTYQKVKANRHNRLRIKNRKRKPDEMLLTPIPATCCCPVCNEPVAATTQEQMNAHVEMCLRNKVIVASILF